MTLNVYHKPKDLSLSHEDMLVRVGQHQDKEAFAGLFNYYAPRVKSYLLKHGANDSSAEEVVQNTFVTVWEKAASFDPKKAAASTWIFTVARNKRIDALRKDRLLDINSDNPALENISAEAGNGYDADATIDQLQAAIAALSPEQEKLLRMAFFEDKSHSAISQETKLPLGTVKSRLRAALGKLKNILKREKNHE